MQVITHLHQPSAQSGSVSLPDFLPIPTLCIVKHSSLEFLALPNPSQDAAAAAAPLLSKVATATFNARVLQVSPFHNGTKLAVLTDHHNPRLIVLRAATSKRKSIGSSSSSAPHYDLLCDRSCLLDEMTRPPADLGLGVWTVTAAPSGDEVVIAHVHSGVLKVLPVGKAAGAKSQIALNTFTARLPHPQLISAAPLHLNDNRLAVALLSVSSTPSRLPGLGTQCLPVLSFHAIEEKKQQLVPLPWGPERKVPPIVEQASGEATGSDAVAATTTSPRRQSQTSAGRGGSSSGRTGGSGRGGPQAMGRTLTAQQTREREQALAKSKLTRAHVTIPYADALGAHLLTALPREAGSSVLVWSETSVVIVTPPVPVDDEEEISEVAATKSPVGAGKRRKGSASAGATGSTSTRKGKQSDKGAGSSTDAAILATSPVSTANEHGKRRRGSVKTGSKSQDDASMDVDEAVDTKSNGYAGLKVLRLSVPRPMQVATATVVQEPNSASCLQVDEAGTTATLHVLFGTRAGRLNDLEVTLKRESPTQAWMPYNMRATRIGSIPQPQNPKSLTYLGEGLVHVASASGDSVVAQLAAASTDTEAAAGTGSSADVDMVSLPTSPVPAATSSSSAVGLAGAVAAAADDDIPASGHTLQTMRTFPSLAPITDFIIDGNAQDSRGGGAQGRIVAACGTGPDGALAMVKNGVTLHDVGALEVPDVRRVWAISLAATGRIALVCSFAEHSNVLALGSDGVDDVTDKIGDGTLGAGRTVGAYALPGGQAWIHVSEKRLAIIDSSSGQQVTAWDPSSTMPGASAILAASVDGNHALVALTGGRVVLLEIQDGGSVQVAGSATLPNEISSLHMAQGLAAIGQWTINTVRLFTVPALQDLTPSSMEAGMGALPRSCLIHRFTSQGDGEDSKNSSAPLHLLIGLSTGSVLSYTMSLPTSDSFSKTIGLFDRKMSALGRRPLYLTPFHTTLGKHAVLALNGESSTVLWAGDGGAGGGRMSMSALAHPNVTAAAPLDGSSLILALPQSLQITSISAIDQLDITKVPLGLDNPQSITALHQDERGVARYFALTTAPFRPEGTATREARRSKVLVYGALELEKVAEFEMDLHERAGCCESVVLDGEEYLVVGTGFVRPDETETTEGRILGFKLERSGSGDARSDLVGSSSKATTSSSSSMLLTLSFQRRVAGNVYSLTSAGGKLVAAINSEVVSLSLGPKSTARASISGLRPLIPLSKWGCAYIACTLAPIHDQPDRVVVGDAMRSLCLLKVDSGVSGKVTEVARDCDPYWTTSCAPLSASAQTFIGSDIGFNLYTSQRLPMAPETRRRIEREEERRRERAERGDTTARLGSANNSAPLPRVPVEDGEWGFVMERRGGWHYGDLVNRFREGSLVAAVDAPAAATATGSDPTVAAKDPSSSSSTDAGPLIHPRLIFGTASGSIGIISQVSPTTTGKILTELERNLQSTLPAPLGGISYQEWRTLRTDHRTDAPAGFLDGDLLLRFGELGAVEKKVVLEGKGGGSGGGSGVGKVSAGLEEVEGVLDGLGRVC